MEDLTYFKTIMPKNSLIWCTEYGINSESEKLTRATEKEQAKHVITATISGIGNGISKMFWFGISDRTGPDTDRFGHMGLLDENEYKKLAYYTYKLMTEKLAGGDWNNIKRVQASNDIHIYKFTRQETGEPIWVMWNDNPYPQTITLNLGDMNSAKITQAVPNAENGLGLNEADYPNFFATEIIAVSNGVATITLDDIPLFMEE